MSSASHHRLQTQTAQSRRPSASGSTDALVELLIRGKAIKTVLESQIVEILLDEDRCQDWSNTAEAG